MGAFHFITDRCDGRVRYCHRTLTSTS